MSIGARLSLAATILGFVLGTAATARGQAEPGSAGPAANDAANEAPTVEIRSAPASIAPIADPEPPPPTELRLVHRRRTGLIAAGAATFAASYTLAALLALAIAASGAAEPCAACGKEAAVLLVPGAGPLLWWATTSEYHRPPVVWPALWSGVQTVGATMLIVGLVGHDVFERRPRNATPRVNVVPTVTGQLGALSLNVDW